MGIVLGSGLGAVADAVGNAKVVRYEELPGSPQYDRGQRARGPNADELGPRFPSLRDAYDPALRAEMRAAAEEVGTGRTPRGHGAAPLVRRYRT
jgi:purine nucleoside phosphorylase